MYIGEKQFQDNTELEIIRICVRKPWVRFQSEHRTMENIALIARHVMVVYWNHYTRDDYWDRTQIQSWIVYRLQTFLFFFFKFVIDTSGSPRGCFAINSNLSAVVLRGIMLAWTTPAGRMSYSNRSTSPASTLIKWSFDDFGLKASRDIEVPHSL